ncbi:MAG: hypothetical protein FWE01_00750 [Firmicutes bacterium]|nr:hypothetical protein [Bacillota bacterium]
MTKLANDRMFDKPRYRKTLRAVARKKQGGFKLDVPHQHCVYANFEIIGKKWRFTSRQAYDLEPDKLALYDKEDPNKDIHFLPPYSTLFITEGQDFFDSRNYTKFTRAQSSFFEQHGHNHLDIYIDVQRYDLIDKNIRNLAQIIEIQSKETLYNERRRVVGTKWVIRKFENSYKYDQYLKAQNPIHNYEEEIIECNYDIHRLYKSESCEPKFVAPYYIKDYQGNPRNYDCEIVKMPAQTVEDYEDCLNRKI